MNKRHKIRLNQSMPSDKEIEKHMDFDSLIARHKQQRSKVRWIDNFNRKMPMIAAVFVLTILSAFALKIEKERRNRQERIETIGLADPLVTIESLQKIDRTAT
ncbi:hypothetical protein V6R21_29590 [Limibacter armeniacum]|uniref:hypothetical protein n=1 Tax=Limibacter armeniacum TaxID=466084 RepID=UPI002FE59F08